MYPALRSEEPLCGAGQLQGGGRKRAAAVSTFTCPALSGRRLAMPLAGGKVTGGKSAFPPFNFHSIEPEYEPRMRYFHHPR